MHNPPANPSSNLQELLRRDAELREQAARLAHDIEAVQRTERAAALERIQALMAAHGIRPFDLVDPLRDRALRKVDPPSEPVKPKQLLFAARYRDPRSGNAWSGNGEMPSWLRRELAAGHTLDDFLV